LTQGYVFFCFQNSCIYIFRQMASENPYPMKTILVPTDFSTCALAGLRFAYQLAFRTGSQLILMHSLDVVPETPAVNTELYAEPAEAAQQKLGQLLAQLRTEQPNESVTIQTTLCYENPTPAIARIAREKGVDLIIMGTSGAEGVFSSVAAEVIETATCPVLAIPGGRAPGPIDHIVFATDLNKFSSGLSLMMDLARLWNARVTVMHVTEEMTAEKQTKAEENFRQLFGLLPYDNLSFHLEDHNDVEKGILDFVNRTEADMLVMEHRTRKWWQQLFRDSHTKQVAYQVRIPLLAIH
jgi:nucleotide-binding universal stress UspA family protein